MSATGSANEDITGMRALLRQSDADTEGMKTSLQYFDDCHRKFLWASFRKRSDYFGHVFKEETSPSSFKAQPQQQLRWLPLSNFFCNVFRHNWHL